MTYFSFLFLPICISASEKKTEAGESLSHCSLQLWFHFLLDFYSKSNLNSHNRAESGYERLYSYKSLFFKDSSFLAWWRIF